MKHLTEGELANFFSEGFYALGIRFGTQSTGRKNWQRLHDYPQYGVGLSYFDLGGTDIDSLIGMPTAINLVGLNMSTTYNFNPVKNYTKHVVPNYHPPVRPTLIKQEVPSFRNVHELSFMGSVGTVQADPGTWRHENGVLDTTKAIGPRYLTHSFSVDYCYRTSHRLRYVVGLDMFYDNSATNLYNNTLPKDVTFSKKAFYGGHIGFHYIIERVSFIYNYGLYLHKPFEQRGKWYMRAGGRVGLTPKIDIQIALKTRNGGIADWIEWGVVYSIRSK